MPSSRTSRCPSCRSPVDPDDFQCPSCQLLLNPDAVSEEIVTEPSIVRALLAPPARRPTADVPVVSAPPSPATKRAAAPAKTTQYQAMLDPNERPRLVAGLEIAGKLKELDAYVASFIDGEKSVEQVALASKLGMIEIQTVLRGLRAKGLVELAARPVAPVPPAQKPPPRPRPPRPEWVVGTRTAEHRVTQAVLDAARTLPPVPVPVPSPSRPAAPKPVSPPKLAPAPPLRSVRGPLEAPLPPQPAREENVLQRAVALERSGEIDGAIHVLKRGIDQVKNPAPLYNKLALVLIQQRRGYDEAENLLRQAVELDPDNTVYQQNLFKVVALTAARSNTGGKKKAGGLLSRLTRRK